MIYRDTMPPGQAHGQPYNGQHPSQQHHIQHQHQGQHPNFQNLQNSQGQSHQPQAAYPQYPNANGVNGYAVDGAAPFRAPQYTQPAYPPPPPQQRQQPQQQQQPASFYANNAAHLANNYNPAFNRPPPADAAPPLQFVNPSFLQNHVPPKPVTHARPPPEPVKAQPPVTQTPVAQPPAPIQQIAAVKESPKNSPSPSLGGKRALPQGAHGTPSGRDPKRQVTGTGIAKSPVLPQPSTHVETLPLLLCIAEDCLTQANTAMQKVARSMSAADVGQHHKLIATGLGCLEIALKSNKLPPRLEARLCLRYANILTEETSNLMEAETALTRGIAVCEKHRFVDLKYSSQFLLMKTLFQRNHKAAFKSIDGHIADCMTFKHVHWFYAFRFLKAAFHLQSGTAVDHHALDNLRQIASVSQQREEKVIFVTATLLEGLAHLNAMKDDWAIRVQTCIAQASKVQLDMSAHLPQVDVLLLLLDMACSLHQRSHQLSAQKLTALQTKLEELRHSPNWATLSNELLLPIRRSSNPTPTISSDTRAILRPGENNTDYLVLSALGKQESYALAYVFHGIVALYKATTLGRSSSIWSEAVKLLDDEKSIPTSQSLPEALEHSDWAKELSCYAQVLIGLQAATLCDWVRVKQSLDAIKESQPSAEFLDIMTLYLTGVFFQGTAKLSDALAIWKDKKFELSSRKAPATKNHNTSHVQSELAILAALNRVWILQEPTHRDSAETAEILESLRPLCEDNPDLEIRTAYHLVLASGNFEPPLSINQIKGHIQHALSGGKESSNTQCLSIALNVMRNRLFENIISEQTLKSAKAGAQQARKSGNLLWMSVAEGMLAQSFEMQGAVDEARAAREMGVKLANEARWKTCV